MAAKVVVGFILRVAEPVADEALDQMAGFYGCKIPPRNAGTTRKALSFVDVAVSLTSAELRDLSAALPASWLH